jgi:hypothetical protein
MNSQIFGEMAGMRFRGSAWPAMVPEIARHDPPPPARDSRRPPPPAEPRPSRRGLLLGAAAAAATAMGGIGAASLAEEDAGARADFDQAAAAVWQHAVRTDLDRPQAQRELVRYATLAANWRNSQPWRFRLQPDGIAVIPQYYPSNLAADGDGHNLYITLGCAVENMVQAAGAFGLHAEVEFDRNSGAVLVALERAPQQAGALFDAIPQRRSTRVDYDGRALASEELRRLDTAACGSGVSVLLQTTQKQREDLLGFLAAAICARSDHAAFVDDLTSWMRFTYREALATRNGLFVALLDEPLLRDPVARVVARLALCKTAQIWRLARAIKSSAGVAVIACDRNDPVHWIETGRSSQRFTLAAASLGLKTAFIDASAAAVPDGRLAAHLGLGASRPSVLIRFGHGPEVAHSMRRPVDQILTASS